MTEPLVSILTAVYNAGKYLRPSIQSILSQTYKNLEIIIIDDGSTDCCIDSIADINDPRVRIIKQENSGRASALNIGIEALHGEFYATHDADDISHPQRIERQVKCMLENPDVSAVFTGYDLIVNGHQMAPRFASKSIKECRRDIDQIRMPTLDPTGMFRMSMVRNIRYETTLKIGAGLDYILRVGELYPMMVLGDCLYSYRINPHSVTHRDPTLKKQMVQKVIRRACERRKLDPNERLPAEPAAPERYRHREQNNGIVAHFMESVIDLRNVNQIRQALKTAISCLRMYPYDHCYYKPLAYFIVPLSLIRYYRCKKAKSQ